MRKARESQPFDLDGSLTLALDLVRENVGGDFTITWPKVEGSNAVDFPSDWTFTLRDAVTGTSTDLSTADSYTFTADETRDRFSLRIEVPSTVANESALPTETALTGAYPNPFGQTARIGYALAQPGTARLAVYDLLGREVAVLEDSRREAGTFTATWTPSAQASGVYFVRFTLDGQPAGTQRVVLSK